MNLVPDFAALEWPLPPAPEAIAALFVAIIVGIFVLALVYSVYQYFRAHRRVGFCLAVVHSAEPDLIAAQHREIIQRTERHDLLKPLWQEFDETLVRSRDGQRIFNTYDAAYFFNPTTLAPGLTENRLLAAMPGILTALGVLGTFIGLQMGLTQVGGTGALTGGADDQAVQEVQQGISALIEG